MNNRKYYVYETINLVNGKIYIGKSSCEGDIENDNYLGSGSLIKKAIDKYGVENFAKKVLFVCNTEEDAYEKERVEILRRNAVKSLSYYNIAHGGKGGNSGLKRSDELKMFFSRKNTGEGNPMYGKKHSEYTKNKIRAKAKENFAGEGNPMYGKRGERNPNFGRKNGAETIKKMSRSAMDSENHYMRGRTGAKHHNARKVICLNDGRIYDTSKEAGNVVGVCDSAIHKCCKGNLNSAGKVRNEKAKWMYLDDYIDKYFNVSLGLYPIILTSKGYMGLFKTS